MSIDSDFAEKDGVMNQISPLSTSAALCVC